MVQKTLLPLLAGFNSTWNDSLKQGITFKPGITEDLHSEAVTSFKLQSKLENQTSTYKILTATEIYQSLSTTLITSDAGNSTQSTMTRNVVSAFTINSSDLLDKPHHNIMVAILLGIFTCISITFTVSIFIFCRKKNSVFMLQKCEQDSDIDLEMNDMNTEIETSDSEYEFIESTPPVHLNQRSQTCPNLTTCVYKENIKQENGQLNADWHSMEMKRKYRKKHKKNEAIASPASTPLLNSTSQVSLTLNRDKWKHRINSHHSLSNETDNSADNISGRTLLTNQNKRHHLLTGDNGLTSQSQLCKSKPVDNKSHINHKIMNSEQGFFEINVKTSNRKAAKTYRTEANCQTILQAESSVLRMESLTDDADCFTVQDLLNENDDIHLQVT